LFFFCGSATCRPGAPEGDIVVIDNNWRQGGLGVAGRRDTSSAAWRRFDAAVAMKLHGPSMLLTIVAASSRVQFNYAVVDDSGGCQKREGRRYDR
jgi:hypothetical protein